MNENIRTKIKIVIPVAIGQILSFAIRFLVLLLWPSGLSMSSDVVAYPLAMLPMVIAFLAVIKMAWKRRKDGTYFETKPMRWALTGISLGGAIIALLIVVGVLSREFLLPH
jgi:hypothetical protein